MMIPFDNSYVKLPPRFYSRQLPRPVSTPRMIRSNPGLARQLGIDPDWLGSAEATASLAGNDLPAGAEPIATVYAGHQFGNWNPQLGDGRAVLLGEVVDSAGIRRDIQLKGSGQTPYSRMGDGRSPVGPVLREYIISEAMATLGVPTTRSLAAVSTGDIVYREESLPGAVLTRVASSHIRVGTFQFFASRGDTEALQLLCQHTLSRHFADASNTDNPALALLQQAVRAQAQLVARWQLLGFIHGVMNTDNMLLCGETVDYGPCAFMDHFNPDQVYSSIDHGGRYAYRNQPGIAHWNLACLARSLLPVLHQDEEQAAALAQQAVDEFTDLFLQAHLEGMGRKLGLPLAGAADEQLVQDLLSLMTTTTSDFTLSFRGLADLADPDSDAAIVLELIEFGEEWDDWLQRWRRRCSAESVSQRERQQTMYRANPVFIPRNHLVEAALEAATYRADYEPFRQLATVLEKPFDYLPAYRDYALPPRPEQVVRQTFCGT